MSRLLDRPASLHKSAAPPTGRTFFRDDTYARSARVGLVLALLLWCALLGLLNLAVRHFSETHARQFPGEKPKPSFDIELTPEETAPPPQRFVETNPDAPENVPDKTDNFAAQNQQVAQPKPTPDGKTDTPATEGKKDHQSNQIVDGELTPPEPAPIVSAPPTAPTQEPSAESPPQTPKEQNPFAGTEKITGESETGFGFNKAPEAANPSAVPEKIKGAADSPFIIPAPPQAQIVPIDPQKPQPRPRVKTRARPAVLADNQFGTQNIGAVAFDARWSNYGQYLQQLIETVQIEWERLLHESNVYPPPGSQAKIKFRLNAEGAITEITASDSTGGSQYERICISGITSRAPYGEWTDDMVAILGQSQQLTFTFYIQ